MSFIASALAMKLRELRRRDSANGPVGPDLVIVLPPVGDRRSGLMSSYFQLQSGVIHWLAAQGASETNASSYTRAMLEALATTATHNPDDEQSLLVMRHETLGGLNAPCREALTKAR